MDNPHDREQSLLLQRIITNVEKLNEAVVTLNNTLEKISVENFQVEVVAQMFKNYQFNTLSHLEATKSLQDPV